MLLALSTLRNGQIGEVKHTRVYFKSDYMADPDMPHSWRNEKMGRSRRHRRRRLSLSQLLHASDW